MVASRPAAAALRSAHSGHMGDYVAWMLAVLTALPLCSASCSRQVGRTAEGVTSFRF